jgi:hypothetical protein
VTETDAMVVWPVSASGTEASATVRVGRESSLRIVPVPMPVAIVALTGADRTTVNVSSPSYVVSPLTMTAIFFVRCGPENLA